MSDDADSMSYATDADERCRYRYKNRFAYLGNGDIKATVTKDVQGLSVYMRDSDHEWHVE